MLHQDLILCWRCQIFPYNNFLKFINFSSVVLLFLTSTYILSHCRFTVQNCDQRSNPKTPGRGKITYIKNTLVEREARRRCLQGKQYLYLHLLHTKRLPFSFILCETKDETTKTSSTANELGLANVGGVFVVLMGGMGVACVIAVCEFVWKSRKVAVEERVSSILHDT